MTGDYAKNRQFKNYTNYWGFYGPFTIKVDTKNVKCNLKNLPGADDTDPEKWPAKPATIVLEEAAAGTMAAGKAWEKTSNYGFLTYKNNGTGVEAFDLYVPVTVIYGFGAIETKVLVHVDSTIDASQN